MPSLSVVIPCFNEEETLVKGVERVLGIAGPGLRLEIIIVDDCSRDGSLRIAETIAQERPEIRVLHHEINQGKGAALRTGFQAATCEFVAVQDADLEYDPKELPQLLAPLTEGVADMVVGSRFLSAGCHRVLYFWHSMGNQFLTLLSNMFTNLNLTDMETCYKVFRREVIQSIAIEENRFGFEPEIIAKVAQRQLRIFEMGISYHGRTYEEGKKIGWRDGFRAIYCILRYNASTGTPAVQALYQILCGGTALLFASAMGALAWLTELPAGLGCSLSAVATAALVFALIAPLLAKDSGARFLLGLTLAISAAIAALLGILLPSTPLVVWAIGGALSWKAAQTQLKG